MKYIYINIQFDIINQEKKKYFSSTKVQDAQNLSKISKVHCNQIYLTLIILSKGSSPVFEV